MVFKIFILILLIFINTLNIPVNGEKLFSIHCIACHEQKNNLIIPEKNLKKETLEAYGINNKHSLEYHIINGKNGMPAFGSRLKKNEIDQLTSFILKE